MVREEEGKEEMSSPDDQNLPLEQVVVVHETSREPIDGLLAEFCIQKGYTFESAKSNRIKRRGKVLEGGTRRREQAGKEGVPLSTFPFPLWEKPGLRFEGDIEGADRVHYPQPGGGRRGGVYLPMSCRLRMRFELVD